MPELGFTDRDNLILMTQTLIMIAAIIINLFSNIFCKIKFSLSYVTTLFFLLLVKQISSAEIYLFHRFNETSLRCNQIPTRLRSILLPCVNRIGISRTLTVVCVCSEQFLEEFFSSVFLFSNPLASNLVFSRCQKVLSIDLFFLKCWEHRI